MLVKAVNILLFSPVATSSVSALPPAQHAQPGNFVPIDEGYHEVELGHIYTRDPSTSNDNVDTILSSRGLKIETYHTGKMEFLTTPGAMWEFPRDISDGAPGGYPATIADCEKLQGKMQEMAGYWIIKNFTFEGDGSLGMPLDLYTFGSCTVQVLCYYKDLPLPLGSGDVYAWIQESIKRYAIDGTTGAYGNMTYGGNEYGWVIA